MTAEHELVSHTRSAPLEVSSEYDVLSALAGRLDKMRRAFAAFDEAPGGWRAAMGRDEAVRAAALASIGAMGDLLVRLTTLIGDDERNEVMADAAEVLADAARLRAEIRARIDAMPPEEQMVAAATRMFSGVPS